jgi:hypothetical protein
MDAPLSATASLQTVVAAAVSSLPRPHLDAAADLYGATGLAVRPAPADTSLAGCFASARLPPSGDLALNMALCGPPRTSVVERRHSYATRPAAIRADATHPNEVCQIHPTSSWLVAESLLTVQSQKAREYTSWLKWLALLSHFSTSFLLKALPTLLPSPFL